MARVHIGSKIRERRKSLGRTQAALAKEIGISPSYLNLIEANKRQIGGHLLQRLAGALEVDLDDLGGVAEQRLAETLSELAADPLLQQHQVISESAFDLVGRFPEWARAMVAAYRDLQDQTQIAAALSDRLHHDPFLADAVHGMLTNVAAIRSAAEIVESVDDLETAQRRRFDQIIAKESERLAEIATRLADYFDKATTATRSVTPSDEVDDLLSEKS
ncbi:MAG: helix-turn-helix domain-containing protein, partial [Geminicoccaceae bacterium]